MIRQGIEKKVIDEMNKHKLFEKLSYFGKPLFLLVSGSDSFGFPSCDSDIDVKGVYQAPSERFLGLRENSREPTFTYMSEDRRLDVSIDEIGHYLKLVCDSNGDRIEWPNSSLIFYKSSDFERIKELINSHAISKSLLNHYLNFARDTWIGKNGKGVKQDLYTLRIYMTGITIFEEGKVLRDINRLNERFNLRIVPLMIKLKEKSELSNSDEYDRGELEAVVERLDLRLRRAAELSGLSDKPCIKGINNYLVNLRIDNLI